MDQTPPDDQPPQPPVSSTSLAALAASSSVLGGVAGLAGGSIASPPPLSSGMQSPLSPNTNGGGNGGGSNRKETILSLVEMLLAEGATNKSASFFLVDTAQGKAHVQAPSFEDDRDVPSVDEHLQAAGAEMFHNFQRSCNALDKELRNFANASRQLGSSVAILASGFHLRERLAQLLYLYRENAADLFPRKVSHANIIRAETVPLPSATIPNTGATSSGAGDGDADNSPIRNLSANSAAGIGLVPGGSRSRRSAFDNNVPRRSHSHRAHNTNFYSRHRRMRGKAHLHIPRPTVTENLDPEDFPEQLEMLAKDVKTFLNCLNEFPEFTDEAVNASILSFEGDLRYWASCLREYSGVLPLPFHLFPILCFQFSASLEIVALSCANDTFSAPCTFLLIGG
ncbi:hypothetical protein FA15DRAFT_757007 [Coprinopsis marcescibilis]|uniref:Uncharacterized protein n=1 Tax=Coprinopsis marcescibilis TaxID=230819 RepID=A0A5C3KTF8_COPMA|nr:hypothetical protein FA15DRAFT_757007 [Coprinopsis marcescibilis]